MTRGMVMLMSLSIGTFVAASGCDRPAVTAGDAKGAGAKAAGGPAAAADKAADEAASTNEATEMKIPVTFSGGHEIGPNDFGRPVVLMAAALGVKPEEFREAFSAVTPARGRGPTGGEARNNKAALMRVLAPLGVTNERMDEVADYYRFRPQDGELWPTTEAKAHAVVEGGKVVRVMVTEPGSGYSSPPTASLKGFDGVDFAVTLAFDKNFAQNGGVGTIEVVSGN